MRSTHRLPLLLSAGIAGLMLTALPFGFDGATFSPVAAQAWAGAENGTATAMATPMVTTSTRKKTTPPTMTIRTTTLTPATWAR